jgi:hypothetical protein
MTTYCVYAELDHINKSAAVNIMPDNQLLTNYSDAFIDGYWVGTNTPFNLFFMSLSINDAVQHKTDLEKKYEKMNYRLDSGI